uniref:50S ribosomal protein L16 n=1 Tax=Nephromyces sp. ex Molgula occidentalis TaxID=2544991 RepID=A0A5C1H8H9_9APIC|nr:50S ribosomal protein L16 [Nephromyces sp. ex Molgula occidentalis]
MKTKQIYFHFKKTKGNPILNPKLYFGNTGLQAISSNLIYKEHIELIKKSFNKQLKKIGKIYFRINCNKIKTKKPSDSRMGSGKGSLDKYVAKIKKGDILFEINLNPNFLVIKFLKFISYKLPLKTRIIYKKNE